ncbi:hypothetical protein EI555_007689, partial [Monodon monoceros]
ARSGLVAYFNLRRLKGTRLIIKLLQLLLLVQDFYITVGTGLVFLVASIFFALTHDSTPAELAAIVFGFLASFVFLSDFFLMVYEKRKEPRPRKPEA